MKVPLWIYIMVICILACLSGWMLGEAFFDREDYNEDDNTVVNSIQLGKDTWVDKDGCRHTTAQVDIEFGIPVDTSKFGDGELTK